jgi:hypothetical protein
MDKETIQSHIRQYVGLQEQEKLLAERKKAIHAELSKAIDSYGEEDAKGNIVLDIGDDTVGVTSITKRKRTSKSINTDIAVPFLKEKGLDYCVKIVEQVDEDNIMAAYFEGKISEEDMSTMVPETISYALFVNK